MRKVQFYGWTNSDFIHVLPSITIINYANQIDVQVCWLLFGFEIAIMKKGWHR